MKEVALDFGAGLLLCVIAAAIGGFVFGFLWALENAIWVILAAIGTFFVWLIGATYRGRL